MTDSTRASRIAASYNESACSQESNSVTKDEIKEILSTGDLTRIHELDAWAAAANRKGEWSQEKKKFALFSNSDVASLHALIQLPHFHVFASIILTDLNALTEKNEHFLAKLRNALLPHVRPEHEKELRRDLDLSIKINRPVYVVEFFDALWSNAISNDCDAAQAIIDLYRGILEWQKKDVTNASLINLVFHVGISRHIRVLHEFISDQCNKDTYLKTKLLEWVISSNSPAHEMHVLEQIESDKALLIKKCYDERQFFKSQIPTQISQSSIAKFTLTNDCYVPRLLRRIDVCANSSDKEPKSKAIAWLLNEICKAMEEEDPGSTWEPILVGSAAENSQALFINEFDYLLLTMSMKDWEFLKRTLPRVVYKMRNMHHPRLALENIGINPATGTYGYMTVTWEDEQFQNTNISIDLVLAKPLRRVELLPHHNFLPVSRTQTPGMLVMLQHESGVTKIPPTILRCYKPAIYQPNPRFVVLLEREQYPDDGGTSTSQREASQSRDTERVNQSYRATSTTEKAPRLYTDMSNRYAVPRHGIDTNKPLGCQPERIVYSQIENGLIKSLPSHVIEGYRLAKAFRIVHAIRPIIKKVIDLGVSLDIHEVIRTYPLKTCVFLLTQDYVCDDSDIEGNNRWTWAIAIFMKLRELVILGDVKEFFVTDQYVFRKSKQECDHKHFTAEMPRFFCCRLRKARLLMVDQILRVLRDSKSKYQPKNKRLGKELSNAVNTSVLRLI